MSWLICGGGRRAARRAGAVGEAGLVLGRVIFRTLPSFAYVYLSAVVFVFGVQADALLRAEVLDRDDEAHPEPGAMPDDS